MKFLDRTLARRPEGLLYHYTTQRGLLGIVERCELWATDIRYLNDASEFRLACEVAAGVINQKIAGTTDGARKSVLTEMRDSALTAGINVSVASFSTRGDLLSQWRAYGEQSSGFSLGFEYDALKAAADRDSWIISPCLYDKDEQVELMRELMSEALRQLVEEPDKVERIRGGSTGYYLNRYAGILKDESFAEEREWRLISRPLNCTLPGYAYREGRSTIVPFYKFPLAKDERGQLKLKEIVIGPSPHPDLAERSVVSLLAQKDLLGDPFGKDGVTVRHSTIPFRNW